MWPRPWGSRGPDWRGLSCVRTPGRLTREPRTALHELWQRWHTEAAPEGAGNMCPPACAWPAPCPTISKRRQEDASVAAGVTEFSDADDGGEWDGDEDGGDSWHDNSYGQRQGFLIVDEFTWLFSTEIPSSVVVKLPRLDARAVYHP